MSEENEETSIPKAWGRLCGKFVISQSMYNADQYWFSRIEGGEATEVDKDVLDAELEALFMKLM